MKILYEILDYYVKVYIFEAVKFLYIWKNEIKHTLKNIIYYKLQYNNKH